MESLPRLILSIVFTVLIHRTSSAPPAWSTFRFPTAEATVHHITVLHLVGVSRTVDQACFLLRGNPHVLLSPPRRQKFIYLCDIQVLPSKV